MFNMFFVIILLTTIKVTESTIYYVRSDTGSNSNTGLTPQTAFATLAHAAGVVSENDIIDAIGSFENVNSLSMIENELFFFVNDRTLTLLSLYSINNRELYIIHRSSDTEAEDTRIDLL